MARKYPPGKPGYLRKTVEVRPNHFRRLKAAAAERGTSMRVILEEVLDRNLPQIVVIGSTKLRLPKWAVEDLLRPADGRRGGGWSRPDKRRRRREGRQ
jgi:hypothetical protein